MKSSKKYLSTQPGFLSINGQMGIAQKLKNV
jgi:hypothetical protein